LAPLTIFSDMAFGNLWRKPENTCYRCFGVKDILESRVFPDSNLKSYVIPDIPKWNVIAKHII